MLDTCHTVWAYRSTTAAPWAPGTARADPGPENRVVHSAVQLQPQSPHARPQAASNTLACRVYAIPMEDLLVSYEQQLASAQAEQASRANKLQQLVREANAVITARAHCQACASMYTCGTEQVHATLTLGVAGCSRVLSEIAGAVAESTTHRLLEHAALSLSAHTGALAIAMQQRLRLTQRAAERCPSEHWVAILRRARAQFILARQRVRLLVATSDAVQSSINTLKLRRAARSQRAKRVAALNRRVALLEQELGSRSCAASNAEQEVHRWRGLCRALDGHASSLSQHIQVVQAARNTAGPACARSLLGESSSAAPLGYMRRRLVRKLPAKRARAEAETIRLSAVASLGEAAGVLEVPPRVTSHAGLVARPNSKGVRVQDRLRG